MRQQNPVDRACVRDEYFALQVSEIDVRKLVNLFSTFYRG
jgi:hypothetical protein